ncbi:hypothetical protein [Metasolibacillus sp.]|uniref:hypothetical protein n=1 Tax=Metasolibacillus sp. TaxID=2703680 RepID=UPI0025F2772F|nr:hypothetical protein [Metasolibacillus sp.]MCT6925513.1 hypothetical protein [Metasolibacillus sp.]MCT6941685.1 hypothetical protein [Metasolibacillus sp.]
MARKMRAAEDYMHHLYVHMNDVDHFVIFSRLTHKQFISSAASFKNLLLVKHAYEDGSFNMHTQLDFISSEDLPNFSKTEIKGNLCLLDFQNEQQVDELTPIEQAELLYIGHKREPIASPFFQKLQNRYVYYAAPEDQMTKVYFRFLADVEQLVANLFNQMIKEKEGTGNFWRRKSAKQIPAIDANVLRSWRNYMKEGALLSLSKQEKPTSCYSIEIRTLIDYDFPDEVWDDLNDIIKQPYDELILIS